MGERAGWTESASERKRESGRMKEERESGRERGTGRARERESVSGKVQERERS